MSGKKGVPRFEHELSPMRRIGSFRRLPSQDDYQSGRCDEVGAALLTSSRWPNGLLAVGRNLAAVAGTVDARSARGDHVARHHEQFRQSGGPPAAQDGGIAFE